MKGIIEALIEEGIVPNDFENKKIQVQGELPVWKKSGIHLFYHNVCPEVNLFDQYNAVSYASGTASTDGEWDDYRIKDKFINQDYKHYCECSEFSKYFFDKKTVNPKRTSSRRRPGISSKLRFEIFQRDNFTCSYCNKSKEDGIKLEIDHKIPVDAGGTDDINNLVTSCKECNQGKSNKII
ncbi:HNH endonuclease [Pontibacter sp. G13]|uniref:HNH endonuclease n=1 Tax=Pontibacter sp. G13 TaxID=3074898 RepID=UPI0028896B1F|nr:HNH endonuclease [Pontibacter sp. G13]WNJ19091.1 HNH endonuclease [Pontibacter sp. G13]